MALNIKDPEAERLATYAAELAGESKTEAVRQALRERIARLQLERGTRSTGSPLRAALEHEIWPLVPAHERGRVLTREEEDKILGYGPERA